MRKMVNRAREFGAQMATGLASSRWPLGFDRDNVGLPGTSVFPPRPWLELDREFAGEEPPAIPRASHYGNSATPAGQRVTAMVLAGGRASRMGVLTSRRPKALLPVAGRFSAIDFVLSNCHYSRIPRVMVMADFCRSILAGYLQEWQGIHRLDGWIEMRGPATASYHGTADTVYQNMAALGPQPEAVLVLPSDHVYRMDYGPLLEHHFRTGADLTLAVGPVPITQASRFGAVHLGEDGRVTGFAEKPGVPAGDLASLGIYVFNPRLLARRLAEDAGEALSTHDFGYAVLPRMVNEDRVFAWRFDGYWRDIGTPEAFFETNLEMRHHGPELGLTGRKPVLTGYVPKSTVKVGREGSVRNSLVNHGCFILGRVENSVLGPGVRVERHAVVRNSVLMRNVFVGEHSVVNNTIADRDVSIAHHCYLGFGGYLEPSSSTLTLVGEGASIPPHMGLCHSVQVTAGSSALDFPAPLIKPGQIICAGGQPQKDNARETEISRETGTLVMD